MALIIIILLLLATSVSQPAQLSFKGARVTANGQLLAYGQAELDGMLHPLLVLIDISRGTVFSAYLELDTKGVFLDAVEDNLSIVSVGYFQDSPFSRSMLFAEFRSNESSYEITRVLKLSSGFGDIAKSVAFLRNGCVIAGLSQNPDTGVSDLAVITLKGNGEVSEATSFGVPYYHSFVEKAYVVNEGLLLVGATWSYNVSMSDVLVVYVNGSRIIHALTLGGADVDEGLAALHDFNEAIVLVGSTRSSSKGYSDSFYAVTSKDSIRVVAFGTPSYDGFIDLLPFNGKLYLLGYTVSKEREIGVILLVKESKPLKAVAVTCDRDLVPLAIGQREGHIVAVFNSENSLLILTLDEELKPLNASLIGYAAIECINVLELNDLEDHCEDLTNKYIIRGQSLVSRNIPLTVGELKASIGKVDLPVKNLKIVAGKFEEKEPFLEVIVKVIEGNIPLLVALLPLVAILIALIMAKHRR
ncbi:MAG: hypothetical protein QW291_07690 [Thermofilaceae archaeon]